MIAMLVILIGFAIGSFILLFYLVLSISAMNSYMKDMYDKFLEMKSIFNVAIYDKYKLTPNEIIHLMESTQNKLNDNEKGEN